MKQLDTRINSLGLKRRRYRVAPGVVTATVEVPESVLNRLGARIVDDLKRAKRMLNMRLRDAKIIELRDAGNKAISIAADLGIAEHVVHDVIRRKMKADDAKLKRRRTAK